MVDEKNPDQSLIKSDRSDQLHEQYDVDDLSRMMLQQKEEFDRRLLEEKLDNKKLKSWMSRFSRWRSDMRAMESQFMTEAAELLGIPSDQPIPEEEPPEAELVDEPPEE